MKKLFLLFIVLLTYGCWGGDVPFNGYSIVNRSGHSVTLVFSTQIPGETSVVVEHVSIEKNKEKNWREFPFYSEITTLTSITFDGNRYLDLTDPANRELLKVANIAFWGPRNASNTFEFPVTKEDYERAIPIP